MNGENITQNKCDGGLITAVPKTDERSLTYQRMLMHGPFKAFSDLISLECVDGNYFFLLSELDKWPANVLYNFCIATRVPIEISHLLPQFGALIEKGYDPTLAFLLSYSCNGVPFKEERSYPYNRGHFWFDTSSDWTRILSGDMTEMSVPYSKKPSACSPTNKIWGNSDKHLKIMKMPDEKVAELFELPVKIAPPPPGPKKSKAEQLNEYLAKFHANNQLVQDIPIAPIAPVNLQFNPAAQEWQPVQEQPPEQEPMHVIDDDDDLEFDEWDFDPEADEFD